MRTLPGTPRLKDAPPKDKLERGSDLPGGVDGPLSSREAVWFSRRSWSGAARQTTGHPQEGRRGEGISSWGHPVCSGSLGSREGTGPSEEQAAWTGERGFTHGGLLRETPDDRRAA